MFRLIDDYGAMGALHAEDIAVHGFVRGEEDFRGQEVYEQNGCYLFCWKEGEELLAAGIYVRPHKRHMLPLKGLRRMIKARFEKDPTIKSIISYTNKDIIIRLLKHLGFEYYGNTWYILRRGEVDGWEI